MTNQHLMPRVWRKEKCKKTLSTPEKDNARTDKCFSRKPGLLIAILFNNSEQQKWCYSQYGIGSHLFPKLSQPQQIKQPTHTGKHWLEGTSGGLWAPQSPARDPAGYSFAQPSPQTSKVGGGPQPPGWGWELRDGVRLPAWCSHVSLLSLLCIYKIPFFP